MNYQFQSAFGANFADLKTMERGDLPYRNKISSYSGVSSQDQNLKITKEFYRFQT